MLLTFGRPVDRLGACSPIAYRWRVNPTSIPWRTAVLRTPRDFLYVVLGLPIGLVWFIVLVTALAVGIGTSVVIIGVPLLALTLLVWRWGANTERERAALVLGMPIPRPPRPALPGGLLARWRARSTDRTTWKELAYMLLLGPVGAITGTIVVCLWSGVLAAVAAPAFASSVPRQSFLAAWTRPSWWAWSPPGWSSPGSPWR